MNVDSNRDARAPIRQVASVVKIDPEQRMVYGWASVITENGVPVVDRQGDIIEPSELERAATDFMKAVRVHKVMHDGEQVGDVVHSFPLTYAMAKLLEIETRKEGWLVGVYIRNDDAWSKYKDGTYEGFSLAGSGAFHPDGDAA